MQSRWASAYKSILKCSFLIEHIEEEEEGKRRKIMKKIIEGFRLYKMNQDPGCDLSSLCCFPPEHYHNMTHIILRDLCSLFMAHL